jgi:hypothetical protein
VLAEALLAAKAIADEWARARALAGLAPHLPPDLLADALRAAKAIGDTEDRATALVGLAPYLAGMPRERLASLCTETLHLLGNSSRQDLLARLLDFTPVLTALAATNVAAELGEVAQAVNDVGRWWP